MGNTCSSKHKDKDNLSSQSEEYQLAANRRKSSEDSKATERRLSRSSLQSGVILKVPGVEQDSGGALGASVSVSIQNSQHHKRNGSIYMAPPHALETIMCDKKALGAMGNVRQPTMVPYSQSSTPERNLYLPEEINDLSDAHKQLLLGVVPISKPAVKAKKIVIYVCAPSNEEFQFEKDILHSNVYPELRKRYRDKGYELHVADLHWMGTIEKRRDHKFPELCINELKRQLETCYLVPVIFLNKSLGITLLPKTIDCHDFEGTMALITNEAEKIRLHKWYQLDPDAQPPCYSLQSIEEHIPEYRKDCSGDTDLALIEWYTEMNKILETLIYTFADELKDIYLTTTIEQEIHNTVRMSQELTKHTVWAYRVYGNETEQTVVDDDIKPLETLAQIENRRRIQPLLEELKNQVNEKNIIKIHNDTDRMALKGLFITSLTSILDAIVDDDRIRDSGTKQCFYGVDRLLLRELMVQTAYCQKAAVAHALSHHQDVLTYLKNYILSEEERGVMVVYGLAGSGKTTIIARLVHSCQTTVSNLAVVFRFVNISIESSSLVLLLRSILSQISYIITGRQLFESHSLSRYIELFTSMLSVASEHRPILIIIDGLDQLDESLTNMDWVPSRLPRNVKFIFSITSTDSGVSAIENKLSDATVFLKVPELLAKEPKNILYTMVAELEDITSSSQLPDNLQMAVVKCPTPLYIKIVAHQYSWVRDGEAELNLKNDIPGQLNQMFATLESMLGKSKVEVAVSLLLAARYGLTDSEMLDILSFENQFQSQNSTIVWWPACTFLAEFCKYMRGFTIWLHGTNNVVLMQLPPHRQFRDTLMKRYKQKLIYAKQLLHTYFTGSLWDHDDIEKISARMLSQPPVLPDSYNTRKLEELPFHEFKLFNTLQVYFLEDVTWLYTKICACSVYQVLEDVELERNGPCSVTTSDNDVFRNDVLTFLQKFLEQNAPALYCDGRQFYSHLHRYYMTHPPTSAQLGFPVTASTENFYIKIQDILVKPPVLSLLSTNNLVPEHASSIEKHDGKQIEGASTKKYAAVGIRRNSAERYNYFNMIKRIEKHSNFIVTLSTFMQEICVWNVTNGLLVRKLKNIPQPMNLEMIDKYRCVVLCNRELRIYDLNTGHLVSKLKGVMNQKMPYYGLHDSNHLVVLSRNRMYINLTNLENGDVVTSFKAGEDRFLNSLLISGNGKILVCGDETQKPFPLLVWNLASRKLLYDLRIAHHDFITKLAAITYEGNYVCCVAKEVDEPGPNFIVVYDLQSGTLFKKWKPGVNCVSLDISSKDSCVLSGHQNGTISIWDLVTGACKWVLEGHTAPVNTLRLDSDGGSFISTDSSGRDRSLRLWSLTNGELMAVYTPEKRLTASEIMIGGKYVVFGMEGCDQLNILELNGILVDAVFFGTIAAQTSRRERALSHDYGHKDHFGKTFDLNFTSVPTLEKR